MKILFVNPAQPKIEQMQEVEQLPPLGLAYLAAVCEQNGIGADIHDDYLLKKGNDYIVNLCDKYDIIGITGLTATSLVAIDLAKKIRTKYSDKLLVCGGPHATLFPGQMLEHFDTVVKGEGEQID